MTSFRPAQWRCFRWAWAKASGIKNQNKQELSNQMNATFASRRMNGGTSSFNRTASWGRNRNAVRHQPRISLGPVSHTITILLLVLVVGLIYLTQAAKVTSYDHEIAATDGEIATLEAERDSLAVENAKITAAAAAGNNDVAAAMTNTNHGQFAE